MTKFVRLAALAAAATIAATPAAAQVSVSNGPVTATARITKPLTLSKVAGGDLDFGTIIVTASDTVTLTNLNALTCGVTVGNLSCSGATTVAEYKVTGTNNNTVNISKPDVTLSNGTDTMTLVLNGPSSVPLANSGAAGVNFALGGSIFIDEAKSPGTYTGNLAVTVQYP